MADETVKSEAQEAESGRGRRKSLVGIVVSDKMNKTRTVRVDRLARHGKYGKYIRRAKMYYAHDEKNESRAGDSIEIMETRPLSKLKRWRLVRILLPGKGGEAASVSASVEGPSVESPSA